jgi:hypothetical protein
MNLRITQVSPSYCAPPYRSKYSSWYLFLKNLHQVSLFQWELSSFIQNRSIIQFCHFIFYDLVATTSIV